MSRPDPTDGAVAGDAFRDANGVAWMLTDSSYRDAWITSSLIDDERYHTWDEAREANLTRVVPQTEAIAAQELAHQRGWYDSNEALADKVAQWQDVAEWLVAEARHERDRPIGCDEYPLEIRDGWMVETGHKPNHIPGYGDEPGTDAVPLVNLAQLPGWADATLPMLDASDPAQLRHAADLLQSLYRQANWSVAQIEALSEVITLIANRADRLDTDTKDRELAEQIAREQFDAIVDLQDIAPWDEQPEHIRERYITVVLAGIRAGRNAAKAVQA